MALLFFRGYFTGDLEGRIAGDAAEAADPAARAIFGNQGKGRAVLERRRRRAEVAADDLAATTFEFEARPTVIFVGPAELETHRDAAGNRQLVAVAAGDRQVERVAAAGFGIAVFLQLVIIDRDGRAQRQAPDTLQTAGVVLP